ncbi:MAG TPA: DNA polymerase III subunit alpha, partial [Candidatus Lustribacter sp.]|nr:DNA polymerase III subunit alpha [Candidatus Lustribacter sp.]
MLARGSRDGLAHGTGWATLCRLVTATHLGGERGAPMTSRELVADHAHLRDGTGTGRDGGDLSRLIEARAHGGGGAGRDEPSSLVVLLGPDSDVGRAVLAKRAEVARAALARWRALLPRDGLVIEVVCHGGPEGTPASLGQAARMLALAREAGVPAVLTAAVRHADPGDAVTVDILDAARRLVPLDVRHLDRVTSAAYLAPTAAMRGIALDVVRASGPGISGGGVLAREGADQLMRTTDELAAICVQDPGRDLGIGSVHLPEPEAIGLRPGEDPQHVLVQRCRGALATRYPHASPGDLAAVTSRLEQELGVIAGMGYPSYFLTVATVCDLIKDMGVRVAARGSGAGSLVNFLLGISGVDPMRYGLLMERFCSPLRAQLPDIDIDVESARRTEIYEQVLARFGGERVTCVSMMDTYRVRHAIRDVGATLGLAPVEIDAIAKAFPHIRARDARAAIAELPELRASGLGAPRLRVLFDLVERLDGLPRHIAVHPCGVILSNSGLLDRTPVEASWLGFPMSQFDKDDVETLGLLKLDILGIRMQSAMAHAVAEVRRVDGPEVDLDDRAQVPLDDEATFRLIRTTHTLGCFQIESPGQRELIGKFGPERFEDLIIDISLFRPGPVKSDMIVPFLNSRHGWSQAEYLHPTLIPALRETEGVVVFHEQVLLIVAETAGVTLAEADEVRRALGSVQGQREVEAWWRPAARARGYEAQVADRIWEVLKAFASFGFCKAHAAAFALPTYQSAWLKTHHPAAFLAGVLTHDPGMYPKRLILDDARSLGIAVLGLDVNASTGDYHIERVDEPSHHVPAHPDLPDGSRHGIRLSLADVLGMSEAETARIVAGQPYASLPDFWVRAQVSRPVVERLVLAGGFDSLYGIGSITLAGGELGRRGRITRRDLLLHAAELDRWSRSVSRGRGGGGRGRGRSGPSALRVTAGGGSTGSSGA